MSGEGEALSTAAPAAPIAIPEPALRERRVPSTLDMPHSLSYMSGPHVITVQSVQALRRRTGALDSFTPPAPRSPAAASRVPSAPAFLPAAAPAAAIAVAPASASPSAGTANEQACPSDLEAPLLPPPRSSEDDEARRVLRRQIDFAQNLSWAVNITLLASKVYAWLLSSSKAVMASAADSTVDLVSQVVISYTEWRMNTPDIRFPVGQARLEALGVLACACIMAIASFEVIAEAATTLYEGIGHAVLPELQLGLVLYVVMGVATALKLVCLIVCNALKSKSDSMLALAEDHLNDIMSNLAALGAAAATTLVRGGWWIDPMCAMFISGWICWRWYTIAETQVGKLVGRGAPAEFVEQLKHLADEHHENLNVDVIRNGRGSMLLGRAYHFGTRYLVEMEVVLPADWTLRQSHDVALMLQHKVEALEDVERAFVHTDYIHRVEPEHKVERALGLAGSGALAGSAGELVLHEGTTTITVA